MTIKINKQKGYTTIEAIVNLDIGITSINATTIATLCRNYPKKTFFNYIEGNKVIETIPEYMEDLAKFLTNDLKPGDKIQIKVEGEDEEAKGWGLLIYKKITGEKIIWPKP